MVSLFLPGWRMQQSMRYQVCLQCPPFTLSANPPSCNQASGGRKPSQSNPESAEWKQIRLLRNSKDKLKPTKSRKQKGVHMLFSNTHHALLSVLSLSHQTSKWPSLWLYVFRSDSQKCRHLQNLAYHGHLTVSTSLPTFFNCTTHKESQVNLQCR